MKKSEEKEKNSLIGVPDENKNTKTVVQEHFSSENLPASTLHFAGR